MADGLPLHFLVQIDCRDIPFASELPERGMLFFFGREDEEQIWDEDQVGDKPWRVIYAPDASGGDPNHPAPPDLPPIGDVKPPPSRQPFLREDEPGPNVHVEWPIELRRIDTWPDVWSLIDADFAEPGDWRTLFGAWFGKRRHEKDEAAERAALSKGYESAQKQARTDAFYAATGFARPKVFDLVWMKEAQAALRLLGADGEAPLYPDRWIYIGFFCRALRVGLERPSARDALPDADAHLAQAEKWIAAADAAGMTDQVPAAEQTAFRQWVRSIDRGWEGFPIDLDVADWILESAEAVIRSFAHDRDLAQLIAPAIYDTMAPFFEGDSVFGVQFSQMLGHVTLSQSEYATNDPMRCLISLSTDFGLGWMFGDVGEASFWISPDALARRDFGEAWAKLEGG
jgi:hypothetical protein